MNTSPVRLTVEVAEMDDDCTAYYANLNDGLWLGPLRATAWHAREDGVRECEKRGWVAEEVA